METTTKITLDLENPLSAINKNIYGHFSEHLGRCIYDGFWVGPDSTTPNINGHRKAIVEALKKIRTPVLRWPGGCYADDYHWRDGIGPPEKRPIRLNRWWDDLDDNTFGTHEFLELCELIGCEPYICGNVGSGTVQEMSFWTEYLNCPQETTLALEREQNGHKEPFNVKYWGVGNENWGCGGKMCPQIYAHKFRQYSTYCHSFKNSPLFKIACGANSFDLSWTEKFFSTVTSKENKCNTDIHSIHGYAVHYYCGTAGTDTEYNEIEWYALLLNAMGMEEIITEHRAIMDKYDPNRKVGLICDEWGTWHKLTGNYKDKWLYQQNTIRDALVAALTLDIFNKHSDKIVMANIAQTVNVLQSLFLTEGEHTILTPTYHVFDMYKAHMEATTIPVTIDTREVGPISLPKIRGSCSIKKDLLTLSLVNLDISDGEEIQLEFKEKLEKKLKLVSWETLKAEDIHDHNTVDNPDAVTPENCSIKNSLNISPASVNLLQFKLE